MKRTSWVTLLAIGLVCCGGSTDHEATKADAGAAGGGAGGSAGGASDAGGAAGASGSSGDAAADAQPILACGAEVVPPSGAGGCGGGGNAQPYDAAGIDCAASCARIQVICQQGPCMYGYLDGVDLCAPNTNCVDICNTAKGQFNEANAKYGCAVQTDSCECFQNCLKLACDGY